MVGAWDGGYVPPSNPHADWIPRSAGGMIGCRNDYQPVIVGEGLCALPRMMEQVSTVADRHRGLSLRIGNYRFRIIVDSRLRGKDGWLGRGMAVVSPHPIRLRIGFPGLRGE